MNRPPSREPALPKVDWITVGIALTAVLWAVWHLIGVRSHPWDEPQSAWLIWPLVIALGIMLPFVIFSAFGATGRRLVPDDTGLTDPRKFRFVFGCASLVAGIWLAGLFVTALIAPPLVAFLMGERRPFYLAITAAIPALLLMGGFVWAMGMRIPLGPLWL